MQSQQYPPSLSLAPFIKYYWTIASSVEEKNIFRCAPDGHSEIFFSFAGSLQFSFNNQHLKYSNSYGVCGQFHQHSDIDLSQNEFTFFIKFHPATLSYFFPINNASIANGINELPQIHSLYKELFDIYHSTKDIQLIIKKIETWLLLNLQSSSNHELAYLLTTNIQREYKSSINDILSQHGLSKRRLQQIFKEKVGVTPKQYQRLFRFRKAMKALKNAPFNESFIHLIGYYDWSHFSKDMYYYFELSPSEYVSKIHQSENLFLVKR